MSITSASAEQRLSDRFATLLSTFATLSRRDTSRLTVVVNRLLPAFLAERKKWAESQRKSADEFNLFQIMGVASDEVLHSKMLAWLLDSRIEHGTHAQGNLGFRLFLEEIGRNAQAKHFALPIAAADSEYWVTCEVSGHESRVDIEIASRGKFLIHIENKIYSAEGDDQTNREWRDLQTRRIDLNIPVSACHAIFLTLDGSPAENEHFRPVGWNRVARILDKFADQAEPPEVKLFARHYAKAIRTMTVAKHDAETDDADI